MRYLFCVFLILTTCSFAQERNQPRFTPDNEYLFETKLDDGIALTESLLGYKYAREWFFPLYELTSKLGLSFALSPEKDLIQGDIVFESRRLEINLKTCTAILDGKREAFDCSKIVSYNDEFYLSQYLYEKWFPLIFKVDELKSSLMIEAKEEFPVSKKMKRAQNGLEPKTSMTGEVDYGYPVVKPSFHLIDGFSADTQLGMSYKKDKARSKKETNYQTNLAGELAGFETRFDVIGKDSEFQSWYLNFRKIDEEGKLLGPLEAKQLNLYHFYFPSYPLVGGSGLVKGVSLTNQSVNTPTSFSKHDFQGELLPDWDVELYQNSLLIGRQTGNTTGLYSFKDVQLLYGINRFELIFYGPLGQERHEYKTFRIDSSMPRGQKLFYKAALGTTQKGQDLKSLSFEKALFGSLSLNTTYTETLLPEEVKKRQYALAGLNGFANAFFYSLTAASQMEGGKAYQGTLAIPYRSLSFKLDYTQLDHFVSREFDDYSEYNPLVHQAKLELFLPLFSRVITRTQFYRDQFQDKSKADKLRSFLSFDYGPWGFSNEGEWDSSSRLWTTEPSLRFVFSNTTLRLVSRFQEAYGFMNYKWELRNTLSETYDLLLSYSKDLMSSDNEYGLALTRFFKSFSLSLQSLMKDEDNYSLALNFNFGLVREPQENSMAVTRKSIRERGSLSVLVYEDLNQNKIRDPGEKVLPHIQARLLQSNQVETANENGVLFFTDLPLYTNIDVTLMPKSLPTIQHRPLEKGYRLMTGAGSSLRLEIPVGLFGDIDGSVMVKRKDQGPVKRGILMTLASSQGEILKEVRTDSEGYYTFEGLKPGQYQLTASYAKSSQSKTVTITESGESTGNFDFILESLQ